jgi:CRP/FNR family transcriptional regulator
LHNDRGKNLAQLLAQYGRVATYPQGHAIADLAVAPDAVYVVEAGRVKISVTSHDGKEQILALLQPGDLFGDMLPGPSPIRLRAEAFEVATVRTVPSPLFEALIHRVPPAALLVIRALVHRVRTLECALADLGLRDVPAAWRRRSFDWPTRTGSRLRRDGRSPQGSHTAISQTSSGQPGKPSQPCLTVFNPMG